MTRKLRVTSLIERGSASVKRYFRIGASITHQCSCHRRHGAGCTAKRRSVNDKAFDVEPSDSTREVHAGETTARTPSEGATVNVLADRVVDSLRGDYANDVLPAYDVGSVLCERCGSSQQEAQNYVHFFHLILVLFISSVVKLGLIGGLDQSPGTRI